MVRSGFDTTCSGPQPRKLLTALVLDGHLGALTNLRFRPLLGQPNTLTDRLIRSAAPHLRKRAPPQKETPAEKLPAVVNQT